MEFDQESVIKEKLAVAERYARREVSDRYSPMRPEVLFAQQERVRGMRDFFVANGMTPLSDKSILEIGCGYGGNIFELICLGFDPSKIVANELLPERAKVAKIRLPQAVRFLEGDALSLDIPENSMDIVFQSTVFSSILNLNVQEALANKMWSWVRPGGGILWYDFTFNNPRNPDVVGVPIKRIRELFPQGKIQTKRLTLAPPLGRMAVKVHPQLWPILNCFPFLRTHCLVWVGKS